MLHRLTIPGVEIPRLYIAENMADVKEARSHGIPYIKWNNGDDELIKILLRPALEKLFPHIDWNNVLGKKKRFYTKVNVVEGDVEEIEAIDLTSGITEDREIETVDATNECIEDNEDESFEVCDPAETTRLFHNESSSSAWYAKHSISTYLGDMTSYVNLEVLQSLKLMPKFLGDIVDCIKVNSVAPMMWSEGYTKKLGVCLGNYNRAYQLKNLIILDVSGSIPRGISATMISLIDTLRTQVSADLIITGSHSKFYSINDSLPDPQTIRNMFGYGNESWDFFGILNKHIAGHHWGHVFSFGDNDTPSYNCNELNLVNTKVDMVHHYHTGAHHRYKDYDESTWKTGYAKWCHMVCSPQEEYDTSWCKVIK